MYISLLEANALPRLGVSALGAIERFTQDPACAAGV